MSTYSGDKYLSDGLRIESDPPGSGHVHVAASTQELDVRLTIGDSRYWMQPEVAEQLALALIRQAGEVRRGSTWKSLEASRDLH